MTDYVLGLVNKYRRIGILVDTNLLLMYFVGLFDPRLISKFKSTVQFSQEDFKLLRSFLSQFDSLVTTPNILTEVNSFSNKWAETFKAPYYAVFAGTIGVLNEIYLPSKVTSALPEFVRFGLTDAGIFQVARNKYLVLTDDFRLSQYLSASGIVVINFAHTSHEHPC